MNKTLAVLFVFWMGLSGGCETTAKSHSGYLDDYSMLQPGDMGADRVYQSPRLGDYDSFLVDPVVVRFHSDAKAHDVDPKELSELATYFHQQIVNELRQGYSVVSSPGRGVLRVQAAITDLYKTVGALNIHPATKLSGAGLGGASMEARAVDSQDGTLIAAVVDKEKGDRASFKGSAAKWGHAQQVMRTWAKRFKKRVDQAHGK